MNQFTNQSINESMKDQSINLKSTCLFLFHFLSLSFLQEERVERSENEKEKSERGKALKRKWVSLWLGLEFGVFRGKTMSCFFIFLL